MAVLLAGDEEVSSPRERHEQTSPPDAFRVGVVHEDRAVRIRPIGEVDLLTIDPLRERTHEALAAGADRVILDLRAVTFVDSNGLHLAMDAYRWATRNRIEFVIIGGPPVVQLAFQAAGLSARLPFVDGAQLRPTAG